MFDHKNEDLADEFAEKLEALKKAMGVQLMAIGKRLSQIIADVDRLSHRVDVLERDMRQLR